MANQGRGTSARSWLFAPGDSERKMERAAASAADIAVFDLEDAVAEGEKAKARSMVAAFLRSQPEDRSRLWVRINPIHSPGALADLAAVVPGRPGGIMLPKSGGRADVELVDHYLSAFETVAGIERGATRVFALLTESAESMFTAGGYAGAPRLVAMSWGAEDLADALGASENRRADGGYGFTYELARTVCLLAAAAARVSAIDTIHGDFRDERGLRARAAEVRRAGFRGMLAIHPAQVDAINEAFSSPTAQELASAREIVDLFAANPTAGTVGYKGAMLDRPHLARAKAVLALAARR
jgi:citrate lyase subunit beta/citryl-CoA lyase